MAEKQLWKEARRRLSCCKDQRWRYNRWHWYWGHPFGWKKTRKNSGSRIRNCWLWGSGYTVSLVSWLLLRSKVRVFAPCFCPVWRRTLFFFCTRPSSWSCSKDELTWWMRSFAESSPDNRVCNYVSEYLCLLGPQDEEVRDTRSGVLDTLPKGTRWSSWRRTREIGGLLAADGHTMVGIVVGIGGKNVGQSAWWRMADGTTESRRHELT